MKQSLTQSPLKKSLFLAAFLVVAALLSSSLFYFDGGELIFNQKYRKFWIHGLTNGRFTTSNGFLFLDRLERSSAWKAHIMLKLSPDIKVSRIFINLEPVEFSQSLLHQDVENKVYKKRRNYEFTIPADEKKGAVIRIELSPGGKAMDFYKPNALLVSADIKPEAPNAETERLLLIALFSLIAGLFAVFLCRKLKLDVLNTALTGFVSILFSTFVINAFSFRFIYYLANRKTMYYACLALGFLSILVITWRHYVLKKRNNPSIVKNNLPEFILDTGPALLLLFLAVLTLSSITFSYDFIVDDFLILRDMNMKELIGVFYGPFDSTGSLPEYYRPLPVLFFQAQKLVFGGATTPFYIVRFLQIYLNCVLLFLVARKLGANGFAAMAGTLVLAANSSSALASGWLSSGFDVAMISFLLTALYFLVSEDIRRNRMLTALFLFLALLSKEPAVMAPFVFLLFDFIIRGKSILKRAAMHAVLFAQLAMYFLFRMIIFGGLAGMESQHDFYSLSNIPRILSRAYKSLVTVFIGPGRVDFSLKNTAWWYLRGTLVIALILVLVFYLYKNRKDIFSLRSPRIALSGLAWVCVMMAPILFPFDFNRLAYILLPGVGLTIAGLWTALKPIGKKASILLVLIPLLFTVSLSQQTIRNWEISYLRLGEGSYYFSERRINAYLEWEEKLTPEMKKLWMERILDRKFLNLPGELI